MTDLDLDEINLERLRKILVGEVGINIPPSRMRMVKMATTSATIAKFCEHCRAISLDMTKCDYCEFKFTCYTQ
jgi:hypothetical protein